MVPLKEKKLHKNHIKKREAQNWAHKRAEKAGWEGIKKKKGRLT